MTYSYRGFTMMYSKLNNKIIVYKGSSYIATCNDEESAKAIIDELLEGLPK